MHSQIETLSKNLASLSDKDRDFAASLIAQFKAKGQLSDKQGYWVGVLADRATAPKPVMETVEVGTMTGLIKLFETAKRSKLKFPAINLSTTKGNDLRMYMAGPQSKTPGFVQVLDGDKNWLGRVSPAGVFTKSARLNNDKALGVDVVEFLNLLSAAPAATAAAYGLLNGRCCFCSKELTHDDSTEVGYGPVCASRWGLPYGKAYKFQAVAA